MKRIFLLIVGVLFSIMCVNASKTFSDTSNRGGIESLMSAPIYWEGTVKKIPDGSYASPTQIYIKVYRAQNMCDSFTANVYVMEWSEYIFKEECIVKTSQRKEYSHYLTYRGSNYYFNM